MRTLAVPLLLAALPAAAQDCALNTTEPGIFARLSDTRSGIELHRKDGATECVIALDCEVRAGEVKGIDYELATLAGPKAPPRFTQVRRVTFTFSDAGKQTCAATAVLQPPKDSKIDRPPSAAPTPAPTPPPAPPAAPAKPEISAE